MILKDHEHVLHHFEVCVVNIGLINLYPTTNDYAGQQVVIPLVHVEVKEYAF